MVLSNGQRQTGGQTTGWGEASRVTPQPPAHGWWDQELPSRIEGERPGQERERLLKPRDLGMEVQRSARGHRLEGPRMMRGLTSPRGRRGNVGRTDTRPTENLPAPQNQTRPLSFHCFIQHPPGPCFLSWLCRDKRDLGSSASGPTGAPCSLPRKPAAAFLLHLPAQLLQQRRAEKEQTNLMQFSDPGLWL